MATNTATTFNTPKFKIFNLENDLISSIVHDKQLCATFIEELQPEFFDNGDCRSVFKVIKTYYDNRNHVPTKEQVTSLVKRLELKSGVSSISINDVVTKVYDRPKFEEHEILHIKDELTRFIKTYKVRKAIAESIDNLENEDKFPEIEERVRSAVLWSVDDKLGTDIREVKKRYLKINNLMDHVTPTPWSKINQVIGGGLFAKTLTLFCASSSIGKSVMLDNLALWCWQELGLNVFIGSLELSEEIKGMRIDASFAEIETNKLSSNEDQVIKAYEKLGEKDNYLMIKEFGARSVSSRMISGFIRKIALHKGKKPDIIILDYQDLIMPNSMKRMSLYEDGGDVSEQIRYLGYEFECPVVSASQLGRCLFIESIVIEKKKGNTQIQYLSVGDEILGKEGYQTVLNIFPQEEKETYEIITKSGKKIICSEKHVFPTLSGEKNIENGLKIGDYLIVRS